MPLDINCDLGEGVPIEDQLVPLITSASVSCGAHAGCMADIEKTINLCLQHGVSIGAHPSHEDRENFGRKPYPLTPEGMLALLEPQVIKLKTLLEKHGAKLRYLKPHGALYHQINHEESLVEPFINFARALGLPILGLPGSVLEKYAEESWTFIREGFADRRYLPDGTLMPRTSPGAMIDQIQESFEQCRQLYKQGVRSVCVHGDHPAALGILTQLRALLEARHIPVQAFA